MEKKKAPEKTINITFEQAMEEREAYRYEELQALCENPVTRPVVQSLVFIGAEREESAGSPAIGFLKAEGLYDWEDKCTTPEGGELFRVAHPADFYEAGCWRKYQKKLFAEEKKQPFKQVFLPGDGGADRCGAGAAPGRT